MCDLETNFQTYQVGLQLPGEQKLFPYLDTIKFHIIIYAKMEPEANLDIQYLAATWDNSAEKVNLGNFVL